MVKGKKISIVGILIFVCLIAILMLDFGGSKPQIASAEVNLTEATITDINLYTKLQTASKKNGTGAALSDQTFKDTTELDLSNDVGAPSNTKRISDITTLREFDLRNLKKLNLANNAISEIDYSVFEGMTSLEYLNLSNNDISAIDLSLLTNLKVLIINNNNLSALDVSNMNTLGYEEGSSLLNISHNNFDNISDITLPIARDGSNMKIVAYNNNITQVASISANGFTYEMGVQGLNKAQIEVGESIKYYSTGDTTLSAKIYKITKNENGQNVETLVKTLNDNALMPVQDVVLGVGNYRIDYLKNNNVFTSLNNDQYLWFESNDFTIVPTSPEYYFTVGNKKYEELDQISRVSTLHLIADEDAKVYYSIAGSSKWTEGREIKIEKGGMYIIEFKTVVDGVESKINSVTINASSNMRVPDIFMALLVVMLAVVFVAAIYFIAKFVQKR